MRPNTIFKSVGYVKQKNLFSRGVELIGINKANI